MRENDAQPADSDVPEHDALALCVRTLRKAVAP
jgi:hypothetical protein